MALLVWTTAARPALAAQLAAVDNVPTLAARLPAAGNAPTTAAPLPSVGTAPMAAKSPAAAKGKVPSAAALKQVARARAPFEALSALRDKGWPASWSTLDLVSELQRADDHWQRAQAAEAALAPALQRALGTELPALAQARRAWAAQRAERDARAAEHRQALAALSAARPDSAMQKAALLAANAAASARDVSQRRLDAALQGRDDAAKAASTALAAAQLPLQNLLQAQRQLALLLKDSASTWAHADQQWRELQRAAEPSLAAGWLPVETRALAAGWPLGSAPPWQANAPLTAWSAPEAVATADRLRGTDARVDQAADSLLRLGDASAWVAQTLASLGDTTKPGACGEDGCERWTDEARTLASQQAAAQQAVADALAQQTLADAALQALPAALLRAQDAGRQNQQALGVQVALATRAGLPAARSAAAQAEQWQAATDRARLAAQAVWVAAYARAYGQPPEPELEFDAPAAGFASAAPSPPATVVAELDSHALFKLRTVRSEPAGFGAYTYVLVNTTADSRNTAVRRRLVQLLRVLRDLPDASAVPAAKQAAVNLFVLPVGDASPDPEGLAFDVSLSQQLMLQLPPGWRVPAELRRALGRGAGPFLVSLPGRMADARGDWPLLFADLSGAPELTVADLVQSYKASLLEGFAPTQVQWEPKALQRVALTLVRVVQSTGDVLESVFPAAVAAPVR